MTAKEMQTGLRGGLSPGGAEYLLQDLDVDMYVTGSNSRMMARRSPYISRRPALNPVFFLSFGAYLMGKHRCTLARDPKAALVNDARLGGFPATHFESYSQAADVGKASEWRSFQAKSSLPKKAKSFLLGGAGGIRTHGPRKANGFRVRLVMTTSILLHDEMISGDG